MTAASALLLVGCQQSGRSFTQTDCQRLAPLIDVAELECREHTSSDRDAECGRYTNYARLALVLGCSFADEAAVE